MRSISHTSAATSATIMNILAIVLLAGAAAAQQFAAVQIDRPGLFQQGANSLLNSGFQANSDALLDPNTFVSGAFQQGINEGQVSQENRDAQLDQNILSSGPFQQGITEVGQADGDAQLDQNIFSSESFQQGITEGQVGQADSDAQLDQNIFSSGSFQQGITEGQVDQANSDAQLDQNSFSSGSFQQGITEGQVGQENSGAQLDQNSFSSGSFQQGITEGQVGQENRDAQLDQNIFSSGSFQQGTAEGQVSQFQPSPGFDSSVSNQNQFDAAQFQTNSLSGSQDQSSQFQSGFSFQSQGQVVGESSAFDGSIINGQFEPLNLPAGASLLLGKIDTSFLCADRPYGFYADQGNACRVFHVCNPYLFDDGRVETYHYSFMCGEGQVFDQKEMTCVDQFAALPCSEAANFYFRNEEFGRIEEKL